MPVSASSKPKSLQEGKWPAEVGIVAMEVYVPSICVNQTELEAFDGASSGKYTIGLGQNHMGFCGDREDIHSLCLTVVHRLMERNSIAYTDIGRMEVGTETILDKSKSVKTVLMQLFDKHGNSCIEGIDTTNACYGGTQALFNSVAWVESSAWDGRFALVVAGDIAVYASGAARPTGGAGAVAMLIGPNAPLVVERGLRAVHMEHAYDFYKPDLSSEYPVVDGKLSILCYLRALDSCYQQYADKAGGITIKDIDFCLFHSPFTKLVLKSLARMKLVDFTRDPAPVTTEGGLYAGLEGVKGRSLESTLGDRDVEKMAVKCSSAEFKETTDAGLLLAREVGNMYTASLYGGVASLLAVKQPSEVAGKRLLLFSYGSGLASAMYSLRATSDVARLTQLTANLAELPATLTSRKLVPPQDFESTMKLREETHHSAPYTPVGDVAELRPGTYYLKSVDDKHRRSYERVPLEGGKGATTLKSPLAQLQNGSN